MPYKCATWDWKRDGYKKGPRHAPTLAGHFQARGLLAKEEVHASLQSHLRVLIATYLATKGPTQTPALARALGTTMDRIGAKLRGMRTGFLVECVRLEHGPGKRVGRSPREWWMTETGRWSLWRQAWLSRSAFLSPHEKWDFELGVPDDPVEAVRLFVRPEFLRPSAYVALIYMIRAGVFSMCEVARAIGVADPIVSKRMHMWERKGWVERLHWPVTGLPDQQCWCRRLKDEAVFALACHVAAIRQVGLHCGWAPTRGAVQYGPGVSQYHYEEEFLNMGWEL